MTARKHHFRFGSFTVKDGSELRFWEEKWLGNATLREQYTSLYRNARDKNGILAYWKTSQKTLL